MDTVGPITNSVMDNALLLEAIAGPDEFEGFNTFNPEDKYGDYTSTIKEGVKSLKIGLL